MAHSPQLFGLRIKTGDFPRARDFYVGMLGAQPDREWGSLTGTEQAAMWKLPGGMSLIVIREDEIAEEAAGMQPGPVTLAFTTPDHDEFHRAAAGRGVPFTSPHPVPTHFSTRASFANDPAGNEIYVGTRYDEQPSAPGDVPPSP